MPNETVYTHISRTWQYAEHIWITRRQSRSKLGSECTCPLTIQIMAP